MHWLLSRRYIPMTRAFPRGSYWLYDAQRFAGTRNLRVAFDVGANVGQTLHGLLKYLPRADIFCFEPVSAAYSKLAANNSKFGNVRFVQKALGSLSGTGQIRLHRDSELNTLVTDGPRQDDLTGEVETISIDTLDSFCRSEGIASIDILKMDVQGWEMEVLKGAQGMLARRGIRFIYAEVGFRRADSDMQHFAELNDHMEQNGYWLCGLYDAFRWGANKEIVGFANALYIQPGFQAP